MQGRLIEWLVGMLLKNLDSGVAAKALVALLRACVLALVDVAARTATTVDDVVVKKASDIVEELAKLLKVP